MHHFRSEELAMPSKPRRVAVAVDPDNIAADYDRGGYDELSDAQLFDIAARVIATPKRGDASSFILHAPLELMARRLLLPQVAPDQRRAVRERMLWVAASYERAGEPVEDPRLRAFTSVDDARRTLFHAVTQGDLDTVDTAASWFLEVATLDDVMALAAPTLAMLGAAGHAPIGFFLSSRLAATSRSSLALLRPLLHEVARAPQLRMQWIDGLRPAGGDRAGFMSALATTPRIGLPGTDFIFPLVHQVDSPEAAGEIVGWVLPATVSDASVGTLRIAALSMLQDDPHFAPYGWSHCLTLPHAIVEILPWLSDQHRASAIAATYVVAFRAAEGRADLDTRFAPEPTPVTPLDALEAEPATAAGAWYHASDAVLADALPHLVARAGSHEDAHLAKYTLACLASAERDVSARRIYLAAAASLAAWWATHRSGVEVALT
jgi:hypothetical protein